MNDRLVYTLDYDKQNNPYLLSLLEKFRLCYYVPTNHDLIIVPTKFSSQRMRANHKTYLRPDHLA